jgi:hypothetical protein
VPMHASFVSATFLISDRSVVGLNPSRIPEQ